MTRRGFLQAAGAGVVAPALADEFPKKMGVAWTSYLTATKPKDALSFLEHCRELGAGGIQTRLDGDLRELRARAEGFGMYIEGMVGLPADDSSAFESAIKDAKTAGAVSVRAACLGGRRYESFASLDEWRAFVNQSTKKIEAAIPIIEKHQVPLAIENHKDWTADELAALMQRYSSEYLGVCLDFGNNIALLDDPIRVVETLAPFTLATHIKDMAVESYRAGFLLSEVVLGRGFLDLGRMISVVRRARPAAHFSLEMITRNPLEIPCLTDKYWATFPDRSGAFLARSMRLVEANKSATPLPRTSGMSPDALRQAEEHNVRASLEYARASLGM